MKTLLLSGLVALLGTTAGAQSNFYIESCNLGCTGGSQGAQISCGVANVLGNGQLSWRWSDTIDLASVTTSSVRIADVSTGLTAIGAFALQEGGRRLVFTPATFEVGHGYLVDIAGMAQGDPGPFVMSTSGMPNLARLSCMITATQANNAVGAECVVSPNSVGVGALVSYSGSSSISLNDLTLEILGLPLGQSALFAVSDSVASLPFGAGVLCLGQPVRRIQPLVATGSGSVALSVDVNVLPAGLLVAPGQQTWFQLWYRDPQGGPQGFNLSNALRVLWFS